MRLMIIVAAALTVGCSTTPVPSAKATPVPKGQIIAPDYLQAQEGRALVVVTRDKGLRTSACTVGVFVDGTLVADLRTSEQVRLFLEEGEHLVGAGPRSSTCFAAADQVTVNVTRAKPMLLRISAGGMNGIVLEPSAF